MTEYIEVLASKSKPEIASNVVDMRIGKPTTIKAEPFYKFNLITHNPDDKKICRRGYFKQCRLLSNQRCALQYFETH